MGNENSKAFVEVIEKAEKGIEHFDIIDDVASIQSLLSDQSLPDPSDDKENRSTPTGNRRDSASWIEKIGRYDTMLTEMEKLKAKHERAQGDKVALREQIQKLHDEAENETQKSHERLAGLLSEFKKVKIENDKTQSKNIILLDAIQTTTDAHNQTMAEVSGLNEEFDAERRNIKELITFQGQMKTNLGLLSADVSSQTNTIAKLTIDNYELQSVQEDLEQRLDNALRHAEHLHVEMNEKDDEIEKGESHTRAMVQHLEDTVEHRDQLRADNNDLVDRLNLELVNVSEATMRYEAALAEMDAIRAERDEVQGTLLDAKAHLVVIEHESESEYGTMEQTLTAKIESLQAQYNAKCAESDSLSEQIKYDEGTVASIQEELVALIETHRVELANQNEEYISKALEDESNYHTQLEELVQLKDNLSYLFSATKDELIELKLELDAKLDENGQLKGQLVEFHATVETLLKMRDELTVAVEEITADSKTIKLELEKSLEINLSKEERIQVLESQLETGEHEKTLNDILEQENIKFQLQANELVVENEKVTAELERAMGDVSQSRAEILELKQRIIVMKNGHAVEIEAIEESVDAESYQKQISLQKELSILRNGLQTIQESNENQSDDFKTSKDENTKLKETNEGLTNELALCGEQIGQLQNHLDSMSKDIADRTSEHSAFCDHAKLLAKKNSNLETEIVGQREEVVNLTDEREKLLAEVDQLKRTAKTVKREMEINADRESSLRNLNLKLTSRLHDSQAKEMEEKQSPGSSDGENKCQAAFKDATLTVKNSAKERNYKRSRRYNNIKK